MNWWIVTIYQHAANISPEKTAKMQCIIVTGVMASQFRQETSAIMWSNSILKRRDAVLCFYSKFTSFS